jgi:pyruvate/2-oxoglutarate dehydrogenase complex dihydrolipoamide dehydrogenase (E3) component
MPEPVYDLVAIGGGSAGLVSAAVAAGLGARTALVEKHRLGGECLWTGCVPSKALLQSARAARLMGRLAEFGLEGPPFRREHARGVLEHVRASRLRVQEADAVEPLLRELGVEFFYGDGRFLNNRELQLGDRVLRSRRWVIATGSRPRVPSVPGLAEAGYLTNTTVFDLPDLPESLLVIGGGPVGVEMAQAFQRLGTQVTLLQRGPRLLPRDDEELVHLLEARLREEGVDLRLGAEAVRVERAGARKQVTVRDAGGARAVEAAEILVATGRRANCEGLGLEEIGVRMDADGIAVDNRLRTRVRNIWACGDVIGWPQFSHLAEYEAKIAVQNALLPVPARARFDRVPWATFTEPELAHLGLTEAEARSKGIPVEVFRHPFSRDDRALVDGEPYGLVKLVARAGGGKLLGAQILGPRAGELIQEAILALDRGLSVRRLADTVHVYPTLTVAVQRAAQYWWKARGENPFFRKAVQAYLNLSRRG